MPYLVIYTPRRGSTPENACFPSGKMDVLGACSRMSILDKESCDYRAAGLYSPFGLFIALWALYCCISSFRPGMALYSLCVAFVLCDHKLLGHIVAYSARAVLSCHFARTQMAPFGRGFLAVLGPSGLLSHCGQLLLTIGSLCASNIDAKLFLLRGLSLWPKGLDA